MVAKFVSTKPLSAAPAEAEAASVEVAVAIVVGVEAVVVAAIVVAAAMEEEDIVTDACLNVLSRFADFFRRWRRWRIRTRTLWR